MKKLISLAQFAELLSSITGSAFAQAQSITEPKLLKKSRVTGLPLRYATVLNCRDLNLQVGYNYEKQVTKLAQIEGELGKNETFIAKEHAWAKPLKGAVARHKDYAVDLLNLDFNKLDLSKLYMPYVVKSIREQVYLADGKVIAKEILNDFFPNTDNYASQPAETKVIVQYMKLSSVKEFTFAGIEYSIVG
jgi:hypothetical protein